MLASDPNNDSTNVSHDYISTWYFHKTALHELLMPDPNNNINVHHCIALDKKVFAFAPLASEEADCPALDSSWKELAGMPVFSTAGGRKEKPITAWYFTKHSRIRQNAGCSGQLGQKKQVI